MLADLDLLTEAACVRRLVMRGIRAADEAIGPVAVETIRRPLSETSGSRGGTNVVYVRLCAEDRLLLEARATARGMRPATYVSVLTRSHLRSLAPLPKEEFLALKHSIAELRSIGRNINQIARAANSGSAVPNSVSQDLRAMLRICEALRDNTKALLKANLTSWSIGSTEGST
jgi:Bacterial mobilisation protein (MobC)